MVLAISLAIFAAVGGTADVGSFAAEAPRWRIETRHAEDAVSVTETGGVWVVDFDILADSPRVTGCTRYTGGWADILFERPAPLAADDERIVFESYLPVPIPGTTVLAMPLVRDADGEKFFYASDTAPHLEGIFQEGVTPNLWRRIATPAFLSGEAGSPSYDVCEMVGGIGGDFLPTPPFEFLGFRVLLRLKADAPAARKSGRIVLGDFTPAPFRFGPETPFAFADAFAGKLPKGVYTLGAEIRDAFQATPVAEFSKRLDYDPADAVSRHHKVFFPLQGDGCHWIDWRLTDAEGKAVAKGLWRRERAAADAHIAEAAKVSPDNPPPFGCLRVNPVHAGRGVYEKGEEPEIEVRVFNAPQGAEIVWRLMPCAFANILAEGREVVSPPDQGRRFARVPIRPGVLDGRTAGRLEIEARTADGRALDRREYIFGVRSSPEERHDRVGALPDRREVKRHPYIRTTYTPRKDNLPTEAAYLSDYDDFLDESKALATSFTYMIDLRDFEVLEGVFDTHLLDEILDRAADAGMKATIRFSHADLCGDNLYRWNRYSRQITADGRVAGGRPHYGAYAVTDAGTAETWLGAYRKVFERYGRHTAFEGYYIMQPGGEWTVVDQPWKGVVSGYDAPGALAFREWLAAKYGTPEALGAVWGRPLVSFDAAEPPLPDFDAGAKPDFRPEWIDFCRFKASLGEWWMRKSVEAIRVYDDRRLVIAYGSPATFARTLGDKFDFAHNGGNHQGGNWGAYVAAWTNAAIGWITEPHHPFRWAAYGDPAGRGWCFDWSVWVGTAQAGGGGANYHVYFRLPKGSSLLEAYGGAAAFDRMEALRPVLAELHDMELLPQPAGAAFVSDTMTLWTKHRTTFGARLADLRRWRELAERDGVPIDTFREDVDSPLLLPNILDVAMAASTYSNVISRVRDGAKAVISADTGSFVPELFGGEPFRLLAALGIEPPKAAKRHNGTNVVATVAAGSPVMEAGRSIAFMTTERLRAQLLDPAVQKDIQRYPYRWIPESDYFGFYPGVKADGEVLAAFGDGGAALTRHKVGKGEVMVFWGTPDIGNDNLKGFMKDVAETWAGLAAPLAESGMGHILEGRNAALGRHYLLVYEERPGRYVIPVRAIPDGDYFLDDAVSGQRIGRIDGAKARDEGIAVEWVEGYSPLKFLRFLPAKGGPDWFGKYRMVSDTETAP